MHRLRARRNDRALTTLAATLAFVAALLVPPSMSSAREDPPDYEWTDMEGTVLASEPRETERMIRTFATISIESSNRPEYIGRAVEVVGDGGTIGERTHWAEHIPAFEEGSQIHIRVRLDTDPMEVIEGSPPAPVPQADSTYDDEVTPLAPFPDSRGRGWRCPRYLPAYFVHNLTGAPSNARNGVNAGTKPWVQDSASWMDFADVGTTTSWRYAANDGKNVVFWQSSPASFVAQAWTWTNGDRVVGFDIQFNTRHSFSTNPSSSQYDIASIALHEFGHALGLAHVTDINQVMYGGGRDPGFIMRSLGPNDAYWLRWLYPKDHLHAAFVSQSPSDNLQLFVRNFTERQFSATFRNIGRTPWGVWNTGQSSGDFEVRIGTQGPENRSSPFRHSSWFSPNRPARYRGAPICPGEDLTRTWTMRAPSSPGNYVEQFGLLVEFRAWMHKTRPRWRELRVL